MLQNKLKFIYIFLFFNCLNILSLNISNISVDLQRFDLIDNIVNKYINEKQTPGAVILIGNKDKVLFKKAYGNRSALPKIAPMHIDTIFDLASLTKVIATATSIIILAERGSIRLSEFVGTYIPEFAQNGKDKITIEHLLLHTSGLIADNPIADYQRGRQVALNNIFALKPTCEPGTKFIYSDVGYIVLGELIKRISDQSLDQFCKQNIFDPLNMKQTTFLPDNSLKDLVASTEQKNGSWDHCSVHDPRAYLLSGVAGHAGLFSTIDDLAIFCQMILNNGSYQGKKILSQLGIRRMLKACNVEMNMQRGIGWDIKTQQSTYQGDFFINAIGHTGFTGTSIVIDLDLKIFLIILTNRIHTNGSIINLRSSIANIVASSIEIN